MQVGAVSFQPYIYNTNSVSSASMNKVQGISDDLLSQKTDYSGLTSEAENINPLRMGESANFVDILSMQMQIGQNNANRIMKPAELGFDAEAMKIGEESAGSGIQDVAFDDMMEDFSLENQNQGTVQFPEEFHTPYEKDVSDLTGGVNILNLVQGVSEGAAQIAEEGNPPQADAQSADMFSRYQMRHAAEAYAFSMAM